MMTNKNESARRQAGSIAGMMMARMLRAPLWLLLSAALARVLGPEGLGTWSMILAAAMLLNQVFLSWTLSITQRFGSSEWLQHQRLNEVWSMRWPLLLTGFSLVASLLVFTPFSWPERFYGLVGDYRWYIVPVLLSFWMMGEANGLQQVRQRFLPLAWSPVISDIVVIAGVGLLALAMPHRDGMLAFTVVAGLGLLVWASWLALELRQLALRWRLPSHEQLRRALVFSSPLLPGFLVGYFAEWIDYFLLRHFFGEHALGLFHPAYQYMLILVGLPTAVAMVLLPGVVAKSDAGGLTALRELIARTAPQLTLLWAMASIGIVAILPAVFALLLGPEYAGSLPVLQVLLLAVPGAITSHVYGLAHFAQGRLGVSTLLLFGIKCALNLLVSFFLLPRLGVVGSAVGSAISYMVLQWLFVLDQHRHLGVPVGVGAVALFLAHASGMALVAVDHGLMRILGAAAAVAVMVLWARRAALFSRAEVSAIIPHRFRRMEAPLQRLLCSSD